MRTLSSLAKLLSWLPSMRVFYSAFLLVVIPLLFYKVFDLMRRNDPPWKSDQDETTRTSGPTGNPKPPPDQSPQDG